MHARLILGWGLTWSLLIAGCAHEPPPIVIHEEPSLSIWLTFDPEVSPSGHSHPATFTPQQMEKVLGGILVAHRDQVFGEAREFIIKNPETTPAFAPGQIKIMAPLLAEAFKKASPVDMVTFYWLAGDKDRGKLVTSGGLFLQDRRLYFILANLRTSPSTKIYETTYEIETRDTPLLPVARFLYFAGFRPHDAWIPIGQVRRNDGYERYMDESKLIVIDLDRLFAGTEAAPSGQNHPTPRP